MAPGSKWLRRQDELLAKLAARAGSCPGLYPFREAADFLRVAQDHGGPETAGICRVLEILWQHPDEATQLNAQSLIRRGQGLKQAMVGGTAGKGVKGATPLEGGDLAKEINQK